MSFLTALMGGYGAFGQARQQRNKDDREDQRQDQQYALQNREFDEREEDRKAAAATAAAAGQRQTMLDNVDLADKGYGPDGKKLALPPLPPALAQYKMMPDGKTVDPGAEADRLTAVGDYMAKNGRPDLAKQYRDSAAAMAQNFNRVAAGTLSGTRGLEITQGKIPAEQASAYYKSHVLQNAQQIAQGHDAATIQRAGMEMQSRMSVAQMNGATRAAVAQMDNSERTAVAQIAGAYHLKGMEEGKAWDAAIANRRDQTSIYAAGVRANAAAAAQGNPGVPLGADPTTQPMGAPQMPAFNINLGGLPPGSSQPIPTGGGGNGNAGNPTPRNRNTGPSAVDKNDPVPREVASLKAHLQAGTPPRQLYDKLQTAVARGLVTNTQAHQIWAQAHGNVAPPPVPARNGLAPLPVRGQKPGFGLNLPPVPVNRGGGSQAAVPFP